MSRSFLFLLALVPSMIFAQFVPNANTAASQAKPQQASNNAPANNNSSSVVSNDGSLFESSTSEKFADRIFDTNSDSVDWDNGSMNWKGKTYSIGNSRVVRARFERYLATDMTSDGIDDYKDIISEILSVLSTKNTDLNLTSIKYAWNLLYDAGDFVYDGNSSIAIANSVDTVWRMKNDQQGLKRTEQYNQKERDKAIGKTISISNYLDNHGIATTTAKANSNGKNNVNVNVNSGTQSQASSALGMKPLKGTADLTYATKEIVVKEKELAQSKVTAAAVGTNAVLQYQSMVVGLITARRFSHAVIACDFYRELFKGSKQAFQAGKKELAQMFPISNLLPSTDLIQTIAFEGRNDVAIGMQAVNTLYDKGEKYSALQRLMETFFLGENEPDVMSFPYEKKQILYSIYRDASTIKDLADARDLDGIEEKIKSIEQNTSDFPVAEIMAKVNIAKRASDLKVYAAKQSAFMGDMEGVERNVTDATMIWPLNPNIEALNTELMEMATGSTLYDKNFQKLLADNNYREIMKDATEYAMVYRNEPAKLELIKEIVKKVGTIDMLIAQADEFQKQNNHYFAWELLENAMLVDKDDVVLARAVADLAPQVADYVKIINAAKLAEKNKSYPEALINYLAAKQISPTSQTCRLAIDRLSKLYLQGN